MSFYIECFISYLKNKSTSLSRCSSMFLLLQGVVPTLYVTDMQLCFLCRTVSPPSASSMFLKCSASFSALLRPLSFHDSVPGHWERSLLIFCNNFVGQLLPLAIILRLLQFDIQIQSLDIFKHSRAVTTLFYLFLFLILAGTNVFSVIIDWCHWRGKYINTLHIASTTCHSSVLSRKGHRT